MTTRNEQKEIRRQQILRAALDLFIQKGFAATKITDIAQAAGMSTGLLFHYFETKEHLYEALVQRGMSKPKSVMEADPSHPLAFFENAAKHILDQAKREPTVAKMFVLMHQASNNDFLSEETRIRLKRDNIHRSAEIIRAGQLSGIIREGDPLALSVAFWAAIQGICQVVVLDPGLPFPDADWIVDILRKKIIRDK